MLYIGLDVHSKWSTVMGVNAETGEVVQRDRVPNGELRETLTALPGPLHGVMETGTRPGRCTENCVPCL